MWLLLLVGITARAAGNEACSYQNPILDKDFPDPTATKGGDGSWYAYATQGNGVNLQIASSSDGCSWTWKGEALPQKPTWASNTQSFWAPDVTLRGSTYYMYFSAEQNSGGMCVGVATSTSPLGPFKDSGSPIVCGTDFVNIDPKGFDDPKTGTKYLYWRSDFSPLGIQQLSDDRLNFATGSKPNNTIYPSNLEYQSLVEGSWMHYREDQNYYYLFFSGNNCCSSSCSYAVMIARSRNATGPWELYADATGAKSNAILVQNSAWSCVGHNSVITDSAGTDWIFYHGYHPGNYNARVLLMDQLTYSNGWPLPANGAPTNSRLPGPTL